MRKIAQRIVPLCVKVFLSHIWAKYFKPLPVYCRITWESGLNRETRNVEVIVSLTSYPARISTVHMTVLTLLNQKIKPDKIILWLAKEQFPSGMNALPKQLLALMDVGLTIKWTHDITKAKVFDTSLAAELFVSNNREYLNRNFDSDNIFIAELVPNIRYYLGNFGKNRVG